MRSCSSIFPSPGPNVYNVRSFVADATEVYLNISIAGAYILLLLRLSTHLSRLFSLFGHTIHSFERVTQQLDGLCVFCVDILANIADHFQR